jgi:hypothetical protein
LIGDIPPYQNWRSAEAVVAEEEEAAAVIQAEVWGSN